MQRQNRLGPNRQFSYVYRRGKRVSTRDLTLLYVKNRQKRVGFSVSKKVGVAVVRKEYAEEHPDVVAAFLTDYAKSVEAANTDLDGTAALCEEQGVVAKAAIAKKALPNCNIVCLTGDELKTNASAYLQVLFDADPKAVGGAMPGDDFYWTAE